MENKNGIPACPITLNDIYIYIRYLWKIFTLVNMTLTTITNDERRMVPSPIDYRSR